MKIKDVCLKTGLTDRTVRFYIEKGLLNVNANDVNGRNYREYTESDVALLNDISKLRRAKFSVQDILDMQNPNADMGKIITRHYQHLEKEQQTNETIVEKLKDINIHRNFSWRKLANDLFCDEDTNQLEQNPDFYEEPIIIQQKSWKHYLTIGIPFLLLFISLLIASLSLLKHLYNQRDLVTAICISEVTVLDKWIENDEYFVTIATHSATAIGYDSYFIEPKTLRVENLDCHNALMQEVGTYMSVSVKIEMPYNVAKSNKLLNGEGSIQVEHVLSNMDDIQSYCTITSVTQDRDHDYYRR